MLLAGAAGEGGCLREGWTPSTPGQIPQTDRSLFEKLLPKVQGWAGVSDFIHFIHFIH